MGISKRRICSVLVLLGLSASLRAAPDAKDFQKLAHDFMFEIVEVADYSKSKQGEISLESQNKVKSVSSKIDFLALAKTSLASKWGKFKEQERKDFLATLQDLLEQVVYPKAKNINVKNDDLKFVPVAKKAGHIMVLADVEREKKGEMVSEKIEIELVFDPKTGKIKDAVLEGETISANLKRQFDEALKKKSFSQIIEQMKKRVNESKSKKS